MTIKALRERRNALAASARTLMDTTKDKPWTTEHQAQYDNITAEIVDLDSRIEREQKVLDLTAENRFQEQQVEASLRGRSATDAKVIVDAWLRGGNSGLSAEQVQHIRATMSTTTGSEGGFTVPTEVAASVIEALKAYGGMRTVATSLVTATGAPLGYPTTDGTSEEGEIVAENTQASSLDMSFGTMPLPTYKYSSKIITVPIELINDSVVDIEALVNNRIRDRVARVSNKHFTVGTGTGQPMGVVTAAGLGKTGITGQTTTVTYDDLADLIESVDQAYLEGGACRFMFHQQMRRVIRKLKDLDGRPIWTPNYDLGASAGNGDLLLGQPVAINNQMAVPAASAKTIAFGDFSKYMIRDVMQVSMLRFTDSAFSSKGQVGFMAFMRAGGNLMDTGAIKTYQHSAT